MALIVSTSPHAHAGAEVRTVMLRVVYALLPGIAAYVWFFGWGVLLNITLAIIAALAAEAAALRLRGRAVRPALTDQGTVELLSRIHVKREGVSLGRPLELPLDTARIIGDLYMYGNSISLSGMPEIGPYEFVFEVVDTNSATSIERTVTIEMTE